MVCQVRKRRKTMEAEVNNNGTTTQLNELAELAAAVAPLEEEEDQFL